MDILITLRSAFDHVLHPYPRSFGGQSLDGNQPLRTPHGLGRGENTPDCKAFGGADADTELLGSLGQTDHPSAGIVRIVLG